ncbi:MAG: type I restriction enzyme HsdR N-terminal domain-containing protein [Propionicimonas sp.]
MELEDTLAALAEKAEQFKDQIRTEEATKNAIIMPFISRVLGYDVFDPEEVVPEYVCDIGTKKGEKIDYAIMRDGQVQILVEAKSVGAPLTLSNAGQLIRYFHVSSARIGVLTNGQYWDFYTDLDKPNIMDERPFLHLDLFDIDPYILPELAKLSKKSFDLDSVLLAAEELKYVSAFKRQIATEFAGPSEDFVRLLATRCYDGTLTAKMREFFAGIARKATAQFVSDRVNERLASALRGSGPVSPSVDLGSGATSQMAESDDGSDDGIDTTVAELEGFNIVRAIVASEVPLERVASRDTKSYFGVLLDDNNRRPICRLHFNRAKRYIGVFDDDKVESRYELDRIEDIYKYADHLRATVRRYGAA